MIQLFDHQKEAVAKLRSGSILCGGVGTGKSLTALWYFWTVECGGNIDSNGVPSKAARNKDLYIITTARKRDTFEWEKELSTLYLCPNDESSMTKVVIDSWNNISKYDKITDAFFIFDEQRVVGSGTWVKSFLKISKKNHWILLSATPGDSWMDYIPVFVANGFYNSRTEFLREHAVYDRYSKYPKINRWVNTNRLDAFRDRLLVNMSYDKKTVRHIEHVIVQYDKKKYETVSKQRWNPYEERPIKDISEACYLMRKVCNENFDRIFSIYKIWRDHKRIIIFYNFDYELEMLRDFLSNKGIACAEWNGHVHQNVPEGDTWFYFVQYTAGAEGWNCTTTDTIVFFSQNYSYKIMEQSMGRIDRLNTPYIDLYYYILKSDSPIDVSIFRAIRQKETFNERAFMSI